MNTTKPPVKVVSKGIAGLRISTRRMDDRLIETVPVGEEKRGDKLELVFETKVSGNDYIHRTVGEENARQRHEILVAAHD